MAVRINPKPDDRAERMVSDPAGYFQAERERLRAEVIEDMDREREQRKSR